ncbi:Mitochondrial GTPase [Tulasnella sp. JGI-2019a]|nr:Mitochondrial GTPase [Tulasnella sp. JGI-2019a]KAG9030044.1 Mitochondrial GTPase [Tulasnella sp. JGI-2019a]
MSIASASKSWFPGHMATFLRNQLPTLLSAQVDVVLEVRDVRMPLTSIHPDLEGILSQWRERRKTGRVCERIVVYTKRDLIDTEGQEALGKALSKHFDHHTHFNSNSKPKDLKALHGMLVSIAKENIATTPALNVLVVGMPNMGKSTLLNSLRWAGTSNSTKAMRTSATPGLTQKTSERLKLSLDPLIYAVDSPGVMVPFLGRGDEGRERGLKLALIAGIKESLYDPETLASFLLDHLNRVNLEDPAYLSLYPPNQPRTPTSSIEDFLDILSHRLNSLSKHGQTDTLRTAKWFLKWWREGGAVGHPQTNGWGFDFDFSDSDSMRWRGLSLEEKVDAGVAKYVERMKLRKENSSAAGNVVGLDGYGVSATMEKKREREEVKRVRRAKSLAKLAAR